MAPSRAGFQTTPLAHFQHGQERFLRNVHAPDALHPLLAFLALLETLSLAIRPGSPQTVGTLLRGNAAALNRNFAQEFRPPLI